MIGDYECHITITVSGNMASVETAISKAGWVFSKIDGDPVLGKGVKAYATAYFNGNKQLDEVIGALEGAAKYINKQISLSGKVIRTKVERIEYDNQDGKAVGTTR